MQPFLDVEMASGESPQASIKDAPPCRSSSSHSKRRSRFNVRRSISSRKRNIRAAGTRFAKTCAPLAQGSLLSSDRTLTFKRWVRIFRPFAPALSRILILVFFVAHFSKTVRVEWDGYRTEVEMGIAFIGCIGGALFLFSMPEDNMAYGVIALSTVCLCVEEPKRVLLHVMQIISLTAVKVMGLCRIRPVGAKGRNGPSPSSPSVKDWVLLMTRCAIAWIVIDCSLNAFEFGETTFTFPWLFFIPISTMFAVGYCFYKAGLGVIIFLILVPTSLLRHIGASHTLHVQSLDVLPFIASAILMLVTDGGSLSVENAVQRTERLVF